MALFKGLFEPSTTTSYENEVKQRFSQMPLLEDLVGTFLELTQEKPWITTCQGYYDNRERSIVFGPDLFGVKWATTHLEKDVNGRTYPVEDVIDSKAYAYTKSGYMPMHGNTNISTNNAVRYWAEIIIERIQVELPNLEFGTLRSDREEGTFHVDYKVPDLEWKDWF